MNVCIWFSVVFYILKYVVATAVMCDAWEEVDTPVQAVDGMMSCRCRIIAVFSLVRTHDTMQNKCFNSIYRAVFKNVLHLHFIVHLYTAAAAEDVSDTIITLKR